MTTPLKFYFFLLLAVPVLMAQSSNPNDTRPRLNLDLPLLDLGHWTNAAQTHVNLGQEFPIGEPSFSDYAISIYKNPSMYQASIWNQNLELASAFGAQKLADWLVKPTSNLERLLNVVIGQAVSGAASFLSLPFPFGKIWLHEEYHRAVMATNQVGSKNPYDTFAGETESGSVSSIHDAELERFKTDDPISFTRMLSAGGEGELLAIRAFQEQNFFFDANLPTELKAILGTIGFNNYIDGSYTNIDALNNDTSEQDGEDILNRDFTGHDYSGWIWHLFKPRAKYGDLGTHPTGAGIDRYITSDKLTEDEKKYYDDVKSKVWLNWLSPMLYGFRKIELTDNMFMNFAVQYQPTSFGTRMGLLVYYKDENNKFALGLNQYKNYENHFYGLEAKWTDKKFNLLADFRFDAKLAIGTQPQDQDFFTDQNQFLLMGSISSQYLISKYFKIYGELSAKTEGWIAGNEYLSENLRLRLGLRFRF